MNTESENKTTNRQKAENTRRTELAMLTLLIEKYPREARDKTRKLPPDSEKLSSQINKSL